MTWFANLFTSRPWAVSLSIFAVLTAIISYLVLVVFNYKTAFTDLTPLQAADVVDILQQEEIGYRLASQGTEIRVPASKADDVRVLLAGAYSPNRKAQGFELFDESEMGLTDFAQRIKYQRALQGSLSRTLLMMQGIEDARVHISMPEKALFKNDRIETTASVTVQFQNTDISKQGIVDSIQSIVANAVPELQSDNVIVVDVSGILLSEPRPQNTPQTAPYESYITYRPEEAVENTSVSEDDAGGVRQTASEASAPVTPDQKQATFAETVNASYLTAESAQDRFVTPPARTKSLTDMIIIAAIAILSILFVLLLLRKRFSGDLSREEREAFLEGLRHQLTDIRQERTVSDAQR